MNNGFEMFCENVRGLKKEYGLTQRQLAEIMRIGMHSCRKILRGEVPPRMNVEAVFHLAWYFQIQPHTLFKTAVKSAQRQYRL